MHVINNKKMQSSDFNAVQHTVGQKMGIIATHIIT